MSRVLLPHADYRLGCKPPKRDSRTLLMGDYLIPEKLPEPPKERAWSEFLRATPDFQWGTMGNLDHSDCVIAAFGHAIQCWSAIRTGKPVTVTDASILSFYDQLSPNDDGVVMLDAFKKWRKDGLSGHRPFAFVSVDVRNPMQVDACSNLFGGIFVGADMPQLARSQSVWTVPWYGPYWAARAGSWGGHGMFGPDFNRATQRGAFVSWGKEIEYTYPWRRAYVVEAYAAVSQDFVDGTVPAPNGFDFKALLHDLELITFAPSPA